MSSKAIDVVGDLMMNSTNDSVKLASARLILDRSGFAAPVDITVQDSGPMMENPADIIRDRLRRLGMSAVSAIEKDEEQQKALEATIDAEVVNEDDEDGDAAMVPA
jgi:arginine/ornithine N-succinyltransferase beta subunit